MPKCGCRIQLIETGNRIPSENLQNVIVYCPLHAAAPELLEVVKEAYWVSEEAIKQGHQCQVESERLRKLISRAEGKGTK